MSGDELAAIAERITYVDGVPVHFSGDPADVVRLVDEVRFLQEDVRVLRAALDEAMNR